MLHFVFTFYEKLSARELYFCLLLSEKQMEMNESSSKNVSHTCDTESDWLVNRVEVFVDDKKRDRACVDKRRLVEQARNKDSMTNQ
jgi:hypothetical protein